MYVVHVWNNFITDTKPSRIVKLSSRLPTVQLPLHPQKLFLSQGPEKCVVKAKAGAVSLFVSF